MANPIDATLKALSNVWEWDGDLMRCRECKRALTASRDGEMLQHRSGCGNRSGHHPWVELRDALDPAKRRA